MAVKDDIVLAKLLGQLYTEVFQRRRPKEGTILAKSTHIPETIPFDDSLRSMLSHSTAVWVWGPGGKTSQVGSVPTRAGQFNANLVEYLSLADNAALSTGDIDFAVAALVYLDTKTTNQTLISKWQTTGDNREYRLFYDYTADRFRFEVSPDGTSVGTTIVSANNLGAVSTATWYFVVAWHDASGNTINIQVNNGTADSVAHTTGLTDKAGDFAVGAIHGGTDTFNGRISACGMWKRTLTAAEKTWLYNSGKGRLWSEVGLAGDGSALKTNLQGWWQIDELSGQRQDSHSTNHLSDNNAVTHNPSVVNYALQGTWGEGFWG